MPKRKGSGSQTDLLFSRSPSPERTLQVSYGNCQAHFIAYYGAEEDAEIETVQRLCATLSKRTISGTA